MSEPQTVTEVIMEYAGRKYAKMTLSFRDNAYTKTSYGCNCTFFETEKEVKSFIDEINTYEY